MEAELSLEWVAEDLGIYPVEAYQFVQAGLEYTVNRVFGEPGQQPAGQSRHVTGQQLCHGLRELAGRQWGYLAQSVLKRWNITETIDFGRIVFSLARHKIMATTPQDTIEDFRHVYDFSKAFESAYRIPGKC
jgi:uncharacterized repeat protein (TIGR04138 family)